MKIEKKNLIIQLVSFVLLAFTYSGLSLNPDETANTIVDHLSNGQFVALISYLVLNVANVFVHWIKQLKTDPSKFWAFVDSVNFWVAAANIIASIVLLYTGVQLDPASLQEFVSLLFSKEYWGAATVFVANILIPILKILIKKENRTIIKELPVPLNKAI